MTTIKVLYDNSVYDGSDLLRSEWGLSCLVKNREGSVLFDTGGDPDILTKNARSLGEDLSAIERIVISHEHSDHAGGLKALINRSDEPEVFRLKRDRALRGGIQTIVGGSMEISSGVRTTGPIPGGSITEQALIVEGRRGSVVLTGCSHPGVGRILDLARSTCDISGLVGGFHGFREFSALAGLSLICPLHCTRYKAEIIDRYPGVTIAGGVGSAIEI